jgi:hypothetical protein
MRMQHARCGQGRASTLNSSLARPQDALLQHAAPARVLRGTCHCRHIVPLSGPAASTDECATTGERMRHEFFEKSSVNSGPQPTGDALLDCALWFTTVVPSVLAQCP